MTKEELIEKLKKLENSDDPEIAHINADDLLMEYIDDAEILSAFEQIPKWYS
jgi:hypothetical protein